MNICRINDWLTRLISEYLDLEWCIHNQERSEPVRSSLQGNFPAVNKLPLKEGLVIPIYGAGGKENPVISHTKDVGSLFRMVRV